MKRVLIITYYWPPTGGSGVQRWVKFAKYLPGKGWQPVIYTPENPEQLAVDESLLSDIPNCAEVIKTPIKEPYEVYRRLLGRKKSDEVNPLNQQKKGFFKKLMVWVRGNFFVPDPRVGWVKPSVKYLKEYLKEHPVDAIVTTGPPQSMHLIGLHLHRATNIPWVADFRDPWTKLFYFKHMGLWPLAKRRHRKLEQTVLDEADAVISVTPMVQKDFQDATSTPVHLITNGFDTADFGRRMWPRKTSKFTVVHTGLFAADGNPLNLWHELSDLCRRNKTFRETLQIRLAGKVDPEIVEAIKLHGMGKNLVLLGYIPHNKTVREQRSADILILPLREEPEYLKVLPGKIFEYLAARRPILGIGQEDGAAAQVLEQTGAGKMFDWTKDASVGKFIRAEWDKFKEGTNKKPLNTEIRQYTRKATTAQLVDLLESLK